MCLNVKALFNRPSVYNALLPEAAPWWYRLSWEHDCCLMQESNP